MRLSTDVWVGALIRRAQAEGAFATVARKGDEQAGAVLVKAVDRRLNTARVYREAFRGAEGERVWIRPIATEDEREIDLWTARQAERDPDLWVVEIEDLSGRHFLTEPVENA